MLTWSTILGGALLAGLAAVTIIGALLPREHQVRRAAEYHKDQAAVWNAISDIESFPAWMPGVKSVAREEPRSLTERWVLSTSEGKMTIEVVELSAPSRLVGRITGNKLAFGGTWTYEVTAVDGGTRLTITEDGWISNPVFRFFARYVLGTNRTIDDALRSLGEHFGETVLPRAAPTKI